MGIYLFEKEDYLFYMHKHMRKKCLNNIGYKELLTIINLLIYFISLARSILNTKYCTKYFISVTNAKYHSHF